uniref:AB hydrolase-1 domain-containing protein n=1 Tax=Heterosigma akashiwo TaxID=2829 RepID=A0A6V1PQ32_HETAK|mmetsp:Transcript_20465/g.38157  ORF Transcript_20465/g.38157 Transcript_20465/m.38157 type:complete len:384 (+) Transcript_20465:43-1194(+)
MLLESLLDESPSSALVRTFLEFVLLIVVSSGLLFGFRLHGTSKNSQLNLDHFEKSGFLDGIDQQLEALRFSKSIVESGSKPYSQGFVFVGGFGDTPAIWKEAIAYIKSNDPKAFCYAPRTVGWGRSTFDEARKVQWQTWVLAAAEAIQVVAAVSGRVVVVGHSTGALAAALALQRPALAGVASRCVFTGPNLCCPPSDQKVKRLLLHRIWGNLVLAASPVIGKKLRGGRPLDVKDWKARDPKKLFYLKSFPLATVREMWRMQDALAADPAPLTGVAPGGRVQLVMGEEDASVAPLGTAAALARGLLPEGVGLDAVSVPDAAHGLLYEAPAVRRRVCHIILTGDVTERGARTAVFSQNKPYFPSSPSPPFDTVSSHQNKQHTTM